ncbi:MAG TPA: oligosaccharide flippase family protein [Gemmatimonadaceae bacterium]
MTRFARNTAISLFSYVASTALNVGVNVVVARTLGPSGKGAFTLLTLFSVTVSLVINLGLGQSAVFYLGQQRFSARTIASNLLALTVVIGLVSTVLLAVALPWYAQTVFGPISRSIILAVVLSTPLALAKLYAEYFFAALHDFWWNTGLNLIDLGVRLLLLVAAGIGVASLSTAVASMIAGLAVATIVGWAVIWKRLGGLSFTISSELFKPFASYGVRSYSAVFITYLNLRFDQFLVGFFLSLDQVGIYSVAVVVAELAMKMANVVAKVLFANVASLDAESATRLTSRTMRATITLAAVTAALLVLIGPLAIRLLFGSAYDSGYMALWLLLPGTLVFNFTQVLYSDLCGRGHPSIGTYASLASIVVTLVGNVLLTPRWGINGAAATSSAAYAVGALVMVVGYLRTAGQGLRDVLWVTRVDLRDAADAVRRLRVSLSRAT